MNLRVTSIVATIVLSISLPLLAQDEVEDKSDRSAVVFTGQGLYAIELAHSVEGYNLGWAAIGYERMMSSWWSLRVDAIPLIVGRKDGINNNGFGSLITWTGYFDNSKAVTPYVNFSAGAAFFEEEIPVANSSRFNFLLSIGGGIDVPVGSDSSFIIGYQFGHLSNSAIGERNPAINGHMLSIGYKKRF